MNCENLENISYFEGSGLSLFAYKKIIKKYYFCISSERSKLFHSNLQVFHFCFVIFSSCCKHEHRCHPLYTNLSQSMNVSTIDFLSYPPFQWHLGVSTLNNLLHQPFWSNIKHFNLQKKVYLTTFFVVLFF